MEIEGKKSDVLALDRKNRRVSGPAKQPSIIVIAHAQLAPP